MTKEELEKEAYEWTEKNISIGISMYNPSIEMYCGKAYIAGAEPREKRIADLEDKLANADYQLEGRDNEIRELNEKIEKLIDLVLSKTECCDVCPITDICINEEGTCPYAGILSKGEEEVTREWLMQFISRR